MNKHVLSIIAKDNAGVLSRITEAFSRRGYNIDSISVGTTETKNVKRVTVVTTCDDDYINQIIHQLKKLIDIIDVIEILPKESVYREIALIKVSSDENKLLAIANIVPIFRANIIDVSEESIIVEATGDVNKITALIKALKPFGIEESIRSGLTGLERGEASLIKC
ncbi:MAG: acetolactate synthase small subunit [Firmicutes bacterium]|nr:acetolactate synthase small subunit [Bacillota bacterium]